MRSIPPPARDGKIIANLIAKFPHETEAASADSAL